MSSTDAPAHLFERREAPDGSSLPPLIHPALRELTVPIATLHPYPGNARNGDTDEILDSLEQHGQYAPVVRQASTGHLVKGNHVYHASLERGMEWIAVTDLDVDDDEARRIVLHDNATSDRGGYDSPLLAELLKPFADLGDWTGTGFDEHRYLDLLDKMDRDATASLDAIATAPAGGLGSPVVSYSLVFDNADQQARWYAFLKWLRTSGVPGDTIAERIDEYLAGVVPQEVA